MRIDDNHMYYGAALTQIAEHREFTAINAFKALRNPPECAYRINDDIAIYVKYSSNPKAAYSEYVFTFTSAHLDQLDELAEICAKTFVVLVCIRAKEICVLTLAELKQHIARREAAHGGAEDQYQILITVQENKRSVCT